MTRPYAKGDFNRFLEFFRIKRSGAFTHTSLGSPLGSYYVPVEKKEELNYLYSHALQNGEELYLTEKHREISPILLDFDFRYDITNGEAKRIYKIRDIKNIINIYLSVLDKYCDTKNKDIYVFEKEQATALNEAVGKDGIHIIIPNIVTPPSVQYIVREKCLPLLTELFSNIGFTNSCDDIFDKCVIEKNNWLMYGSTKPNGQYYQISKIYRCSDNKLESVSVSNTLQDYIELFSIQNKYDPSDIKIEMHNEVSNYELAVLEQQKKKEAMAQALRTIAQTHKNETDNLELVQKLVDILSVKRADNYTDWIRVGWCLRIIDYRLLPAWIAFSKKSEKYVDDGECEKRWDYMKETGLGIGTLRMWAKQDNPEEFENIIREDTKGIMMKALNMTDYDIAKVVYNMYKYDYVCANIKTNTWYQFRRHRWEPIDSGYTLRLHMSDYVANEFLKLNSTLSMEAANELDEDRKKMITEKSGKAFKVSNYLRTVAKKNNILKECGELFYIEKFEEKLDSNTQIIGFKNGVYDLDLMEFRDGRPDDFISFSTKINYIEYNENNPINVEIMDFVGKVLPKEHILDYVMKLFASFLNGSVKEQKFHIWTGSGGNGKSAVIELFQKTFGEYCGVFNVSLLTQKRGKSNDTNVELVKAKGKRFMLLQEPEAREKINVGVMKELTGGDTCSARGLYKDPIEFKPQFKLVLVCNDLPQVPSSDGGSWRRIRVLDFISKFVDKLSKKPGPYEYLVDKTLAGKFESWSETFMSILIQYYRKYATEGIIEPEEVLSATNSYQKENDSYVLYFEDNIVDDISSSLSTDVIYDDFKYWWKDTAPDSKCPLKKDFRNYMVKHYGNCKNNVWKGIALKNQNNFNKEVDEI